MFRRVLYYIFLPRLCIFLVFLVIIAKTKALKNHDDLGWNAHCKLQADTHKCVKRPVARYYYDLKLQDCTTFNYGGCSYNRNAFATKIACREACQDVGPLPVKENVSNLVFCSFQPDFGECQSYHPMWYYDVVHQKCRGFSYSGCGGNANRFRTQQLCMASCSAARALLDAYVLPEDRTTTVAETSSGNKTKKDELKNDVFCKYQADTFRCKERPVPKYYYDLKLEDCKDFLYGGCRPSKNVYDTKILCREACQDVGLHLVTRNLTSKIFCRMQPDFGHCQQYHPMWYYDITRHACRGFSYSGCGGNYNRFESQQICMKTCGDTRDANKIKFEAP